MSGRKVSPNIHDQATSGRDRKHWLDFGIALLLLATAAGTGVAAWYTFRQWVTARDTLVVSQRAFVTVGNINVIMSVGDDQKLNYLNVDIPVQNSGNTRTRDLQVLFKCRTSTQDLVEPWGLLHQEKIEHLPQVLGPHADGHVYCPFTNDDVSRMKSGSLFGYVLGEMTYYDIFNPNDRHITQIARKVVILNYTETPPFVVSSFTSVGQHNCADEDCP